MTIETKYNVEDEVWLIYENKVIQQAVSSIYTTSSIEYGALKNNSVYYIRFCSGEFRECDLFPTKEALLQSL